MFDNNEGDEKLSGACSDDELRALEAHHDDAWRWALSCCRGDRELALETLHDAYLAILEGKARPRGGASFKTFLFGVIRVTALATRRRAVLRWLIFAPIEAATPVRVEPDHEIAACAREAADAMARLPPRQRSVAELTLLQGLTIGETAAVLGVSEGSVRRHYALAKSKLRAALNIEEDENAG